MLVVNIPENPNTFAANVPGVIPGSIVVDPTGATSNIGVVVRTSPTTNEVVVISGQRVVLTAGEVVWTPGAGGDGTLAITVLDNTGSPINGAEVEVTLLAAAALTSVTPSLGTVTYSDGLATTNAIVRALVDAAGHLTLTIDGTAATALRYTVRVIGLPQVGTVQQLSPTVVSVSIVLPA